MHQKSGWRELMIFLQDDVIILRPLDVTDADGDYPTWLNDEITCAGNGHHRIPYTRGDARTFVETTRESSDSIVLAIETKNGNEIMYKIIFIFSLHQFEIKVGFGALC